jgi:hypothetical protein
MPSPNLAYGAIAQHADAEIIETEAIMAFVFFIVFSPLSVYRCMSYVPKQAAAYFDSLKSASR